MKAKTITGDLRDYSEGVRKNNVSIIPATKRCMQNGDHFRKAQSLRVAAYCRVSTEEESQQNSYAVQKSYYTSLILSRPGWEMAGVYADEGKSGTTRKSRVHFNRMMEDAREGKIDYIITKSISRFARNTVDALDCIHELQRLRPPVGIYFEREKIDTMNQNSEMFLTFYCSMAQEESHSISENIKWALRRKMAEGKPQINLRRMLGYDQSKDGEWIINEEQAVIVCYIFDRFLQGISANRIARELNESGRRTVNGNLWRADGILDILRNEKYVGDLLMQKTYTESFLTHKSIKNTGEVTQYFKANHHPAIISRKTWDKAQEILQNRRRSMNRAAKTIHTREGDILIETEERQDGISQKSRCGAIPSPFTGLVCGNCGEKYRRLTYHCAASNYTDERARPETSDQTEEAYENFFDFSYGVWKCRGTARNRLADPSAARSCHCAALIEISMEQSFMEMLYRIRRDCQLNGEDADIARSFRRLYEIVRNKEVNSGFIEQKLELLKLEIDRLDAACRDACIKQEAAASAAGIYLAADIDITQIADERLLERGRAAGGGMGSGRTGRDTAGSRSGDAVWDAIGGRSGSGGMVRNTAGSGTGEMVRDAAGDRMEEAVRNTAGSRSGDAVSNTVGSRKYGRDSAEEEEGRKRQTKEDSDRNETTGELSGRRKFVTEHHLEPDSSARNAGRNERNKESGWKYDMGDKESLTEDDGAFILCGNAARYEMLARDLKKRLEEKKAEYRSLLQERGAATKMKLNYEAFIKALADLPDTNEAGVKLNINTLDVYGSIFRTAGGQRRGWNRSRYNRGELKITPEVLSKAPDYLRFDEYYLRTFFLGMTACGDEIRYTTTFGLILSSIGNTRSIKSYIGYRRGKEDGTLDMIMESYQLAKGSIQYHWRKKTKWRLAESKGKKQN